MIIMQQHMTATDIMRANKAMSVPNLFASVGVMRAHGWLAGILLLLSFSNAFAESDGLFSGFADPDFSVFWNDFKAAVIAGDKVKVVEMTKFPLSMPYEVKAVKNKQDFQRRYDKIFKGEANAAQCFAKAEPRKESTQRYEVYCPFKDTPNDWENAPIRFVFEMTKGGWKFTGLDNINE
jgi:hypothetical protein